MVVTLKFEEKISNFNKSCWDKNNEKLSEECFTSRLCMLNM